ncbi:MAG: hypothetical protein GIX03_03245 [Candidatus Eremiobacteraeota bacterium]|nr:hypothetical protein [Candidatus Eremiobacteraeota bacterium]MBC5802029.1 hypothetical protein [Candidatus Eremiobacteraeota bacterium]MBC5822567.1 hypothetical protein [Candidatus Eremiobacteraeota bacterium]
MIDAFSYLSVLLSIIIGLGMSHLLGAMVRVIHNRSGTALYLPSIVWAANLFLLLTLVWWADFNLTRHQHWTFPIFLCTLSIPAAVYAASGLILPTGEAQTQTNMRSAYEENRRWFFSLIAFAIALSFVQTYLLDGRIAFDADAQLKAAILLVTLVPIFTKADIVQRTVAAINLAWVLAYITLLFYNLRY